MEELRSEEGITRADEVADLDPYNVRTSPQEEAAKVLLKVPKTEKKRTRQVPEKKEDDLWKTLIKREEKVWKQILGTGLYIKPLPVDEKGNQIITKSLIDKLDNLNMQLIYMPDLEGNLSVIDLFAQGQTIPQYLNSNYPNWKPYEDLKEKQIGVRANYRNINNKFWENVKNKSIDLPRMPGQWVAIELNSDNPNGAYYGNQTPPPLNTYLGINSRASTYHEVQQILADRTYFILQGVLGLEEGQAELRLPNALETNLYLNRLEQRNIWPEWTSTSHHKSFGREAKVIIRGAEDAQSQGLDSREQNLSDIQFRTIIAFK